MQQTGETTHFGYRDVPVDEKETLVGGVFHSVAGRYDLMNDLMSGGLHRLWKAALIDWLAPPRGGPFHLLDVAGGTGDIAFRFCERAGRDAHATILDINGSMLSVGRDRAIKKGHDQRTRFVEANAEYLPFPDAHFDAYTIAFGIRNVTRIEAALAEAFRVLKPGGRFLCLEFSAVDVPVIDRIYENYSFKAIPVMGRMVTGDAASYRYLVESIRQFPEQDRFLAMIEAAGFARAQYRNLSGGVAALHSAWRI